MWVDCYSQVIRAHGGGRVVGMVDIGFKLTVVLQNINIDTKNQI